MKWFKEYVLTMTGEKIEGILQIALKSEMIVVGIKTYNNYQIFARISKMGEMIRAIYYQQVFQDYIMQGIAIGNDNSVYLKLLDAQILQPYIANKYSCYAIYCL
ncbi:UNKNOWN [Stylonychia lemnae]|uniref:Uncharacterized protein n=1 Tax=Stylonychia lemnae TaxID=5949 RepID=A0A078A5T2_STYLE|nr:UNKNOWN [Stylonychia lemnae]|eukprot:CDW76905.1 UNKNOWN [Stylonychia lemnae]